MVEEGAQRVVDPRLVGVRLRAPTGLLDHKAGDMRRVGALDVLGGNAVGGPVLDADHGLLADGAAAGVRQFLPLGVRHVLALATEVGLVRLDGAGERLVLLGQRDPQTMG